MEYTKEYLERLITDKIEESSEREYKAAGSLGRSDDQKREITKDISALANSAGGTIIYGIREHTKPDLRHLPERLDPVNQCEYSREWLDQIAGLIQPRIERLRIIPVHVGPQPSDYCYVVEVPQSGTAHQALDRRYYRRRNFEASPMEDYEIRDVMNRRKHPLLAAQVRVVTHSLRGDKPYIAIHLNNTSRVMARCYAVVVQMPFRLSVGMIRIEDAMFDEENGHGFFVFSLGNGIGTPLFPRSDVTLKKEFSRDPYEIPDPCPSIQDIRLTLYADEMEKIELSKDLSRAEREWA